jgi:hypothetical protein
MHEVCGKILCNTLEDEKDRTAGRFRVYYADFESAGNHGFNAFQILDTYEHTYEYTRSILGSKQPFSERLLKLLEYEIWNSNLLILDRIEILPRYRGGGAGLLILIGLIERFGAGAGVIAMKPFPLQFEDKQPHNSSAWAKRLRLEDLPRNEKMSKEKLKQYYGKLGFVGMKSTPFMFRGMA